jgi:hypothetical protein
MELSLLPEWTNVTVGKAAYSRNGYAEFVLGEQR